ncbi:hypothetical protein QQZ08_007846 [Neonectria magnoliae]|uniref:Phospholipase/carboxylesterase/thioesterase domain-containing protein n=1 Tax=Neonectria magnoliae TaxID=2732573 RepID=A0ABR1HXP8_9HYPO
MAEPAQIPTHTVQPSKAHTHTFILLHDCVSNGAALCAELEAALAPIAVRDILPQVLFVFPSGDHATPGFPGHLNWFSLSQLGETDRRGREAEWRMVADAAHKLDTLVTAEAMKVGWDNVFVGGIGMGAAVGMAFLLQTTTKLGGFFGLGGWMPFVDDIASIATRDTLDRDVLPAVISPPSVDDLASQKSDDTSKPQVPIIVVDRPQGEKDAPIPLEPSLVDRPFRADYEAPIFGGRKGDDCVYVHGATTHRGQRAWESLMPPGGLYQVPGIDAVLENQMQEIIWSALTPMMQSDEDRDMDIAENLRIFFEAELDSWNGSRQLEVLRESESEGQPEGEPEGEPESEPDSESTASPRAIPQRMPMNNLPQQSSEDRLTRVVTFLRCFLDTNTDGQNASLTAVDTPVVLVHAAHDTYVPRTHGKEALEVLRKLGFQVKFKNLEEGDHLVSHGALQEFLLTILNENIGTFGLREGIANMALGNPELKGGAAAEAS